MLQRMEEMGRRRKTLGFASGTCADAGAKAQALLEAAVSLSTCGRRCEHEHKPSLEASHLTRPSPPAKNAGLRQWDLCRRRRKSTSSVGGCSEFEHLF